MEEASPFSSVVQPDELVHPVVVLGDRRVDAAGTARQSIFYDAWGNERERIGASSNKFTFTGHEKDGETGLVYAKARFYEPGIGRFLTQDVLLGTSDNPPSLHRYAYVNANPLLYADPTGLASQFVGTVYQLEVVIDGQTQIYTGSAANLKRRLTRDKHEWSHLIRDKRTKVSHKRVYGELNVRASGQKTLASARNEALRAAEQKELDLTKKRVDAENENLPKGRKRTEILNVDEAAADPELFRERHKVTSDRKWKTIKEPGGPLKMPKGSAIGGMAALAVWDAFMMAREMKEEQWRAQYEWAPYVLEDEGGVFILEEGEWLFSTYYYKTYLNQSGEATEENRLEIEAEEFKELKEEAEALWGTFDENKEFVPGLLNRELKKKPDA